MKTRLIISLLALLAAVLACNAPAEGGTTRPPTDEPSQTLTEAWRQALDLSQGNFNVTLTEAMIEQAIARNMQEQGAAVEANNIDIIINADGTMQLRFSFVLESNTGTSADAVIDYTAAVTDAGGLNVTVTDAAVEVLGGASIAVPTDLLNRYNSAINEVLSGAALAPAGVRVTLTDITYEQGSLTISGNASRE